MKIEHVEVINLRFEYAPECRFRYAGGTASGRLTSLVRVVTDTGQTGIGAAYSHPDIVRLVVEQHLAPLLLGADPREVEDLWLFMYRQTRWYGRKGEPRSPPMGALDTAFWDLRGKYAREDRGRPARRASATRCPPMPADYSGMTTLGDLARRGDAGTSGAGSAGSRCGSAGSEEYGHRSRPRRAAGAWDPEIDVIVDASMRYTVEIADAHRPGARSGKRLLVRGTVRAG